MTSEKLFQILERLNVTPEELLRVIDKESNQSPFYFYETLNDAVKKKRVELLQQLSEQEKHFFKMDKHIRHLHNQILVKEYINLFVHLPIDKKQVKKLMQYLSQVEEWGHYELRLLIYSFSLFSVNQIDILSHYVFRRTVLHRENILYRKDLVTLMIKCVYFFIRHDNLLKAKQFIQQT